MCLSCSKAGPSLLPRDFGRDGGRSRRTAAGDSHHWRRDVRPVHGYRLKSAGLPFTIFEEGAEVGGTWRENTYPGLHVDVITRSYEFPFARSRAWSKRYAPGTEIRNYLRKLSTDLSLTSHIVFNTEITDARLRRRRLDDHHVSGRVRRVDVIYCGTGFLRVPTVPDIPGREASTGPAFHSSRRTTPSTWPASGSAWWARFQRLQIVTELGKRGE